MHVCLRGDVFSVFTPSKARFARGFVSLQKRRVLPEKARFAHGLFSLQMERISLFLFKSVYSDQCPTPHNINDYYKHVSANGVPLKRFTLKWKITG